MKRPEITWSLMHPTPLDPLYVEKLVNIANLSKYHVLGQILSLTVSGNVIIQLKINLQQIKLMVLFVQIFAVGQLLVLFLCL